jgi:hypothetical protein
MEALEVPQQTNRRLEREMLVHSIMQHLNVTMQMDTLIVSTALYKLNIRELKALLTLVSACVEEK